jgi:hypothetical protein
MIVLLALVELPGLMLTSPLSVLSIPGTKLAANALSPTRVVGMLMLLMKIPMAHLTLVCGKSIQETGLHVLVERHHVM